LGSVLSGLLRAFSYLFHLILALFLAGIALVTILTGVSNLSLGMLPWKGQSLPYWLLGLCLFGILTVVLSATGRMKSLFVLWALFVFALMIRGFFLTSYHFSGPAQARGAAWLTFGALGAVFGSLMALRSGPQRKDWR